MDNDIFFEDTRTAKKICGECLVSAECLEFALKFNKNFGVWGGATVHERSKMRTKRRKNGQL
jgi:WhiB family redox-sensing transcriptional regulator